MALTQISTGMLASGDGTVDLNIDNGTFVVDVSTSRVGIGTSSPQSIVHIDQGASIDAQLTLETHAAGDSKLVFSQGQTAGNWAVGYDDGGGVTENSLSFAYKADGYPSLSGQNKMILTPAGSVGIGTSSPSAGLDVAYGSAGTIAAEFKNAAGFGISITPQVGGSGSVTQIGLAAGESLSFAPNNAEAMRINSSGTVSINSNGSIAALDGVTGVQIGNSSAASAGLALETSNRGYLWYINSSALNLWDSTANSDRLTITSAGNVGIGVVPESWQSTIDALQVGLGASFAGNTVNPSRVYLSANYYINSSNQESYIATDEASQYFQNAGTHTFKVAPSGTADSAISWITAATIDNSGNVGIGVTPSAAYKMQVAVATNTVSTGSPAAGSIFNISGGTTTVGDGVSLQLTNISGAKETGWRISAVTESGNNGDLVFNGYGGGADYPERMRINNVGDIILSNQIHGGFGAKGTGGTLDWNHATNARSGMGYSLLLGTATNGMGGNVYYHVVNYEYGSKNGTGNLTQIAIPYYGTSTIYSRNKYQGVWSSWGTV